MARRVGEGQLVGEAVNGDIKAIRDFILEAWREAGPSAWGWTGATAKSVRELASPEHLRKLISNPKIRILLAKQDETILGFAATRKVTRDTVELAGIIVQERHTGRGVGTSLVKAVLDFASDQRFADIIVKTETFNKRAIGFYEANGFARVGVTKEDVEGKSIDLALLRREVGSLKGPKTASLSATPCAAKES